jgi:vancomycin resistance protein VanJ
VLVATAVGYPLSLALVVLGFRLIGERWWITGLGLYLPRLGFALPLPFIVAACALARRRRLLLLQLASSLLLVFPLLGFNIAWSAGQGVGKPLRVLSYNVNSGYGGFPAIAAEILQFDPDVVLVQELFAGSEPLELALRSRYPFQHVSGQFMVASRFPILASVDPPRLPFFGRERSPRYMRYVIETPLGKVTFFNIHTVSPRGGIYAIRGGGLRKEILSGRLMAGTEADTLQSTAGLRELQVDTLTNEATRETGPIIIAGDTNLPGLSRVFAKTLGRYRDAFSETRSGFGYTYPVKFPWMRIDRILSNDRLTFSGFEIGKSKASDHHCVVAEFSAATRLPP